MRLILTTMASAVLLMSAPGMISDAFAHGGAYRGPAGEVPPDSREPSDPPPPPEGGGPTTGGGDPGGPTTGGDDVGGPSTGGDDGGGPTTGGDGGGPAPSGGGPGGATTGGGKGRPTPAAKGPGYEDWTFWWNFNKDEILQLKSEVKKTQHGTQSGTSVHEFSRRTSSTEVKTATDAAINEKIVPALQKMLEEDDLNFDIQSAAALALAKIGDRSIKDKLKDMATDKGGKYHRVVVESSALAFGLLQDDSDDVRDFLIEIVTDRDNNASFVRPFAAISLGLLGDANDPDGKVVQTMMDILAEKETKKDIKPAALMALGLLENDAIVPDLLSMLENKKVDRKGSDDLSDTELAFVVQALGKIGRPGTDENETAVVDAVLGLLPVKRGRQKVDVNVRRSAVIALGSIGPQCSEKMQGTIIKQLKNTAKEGKDMSERNFAMISLGRLASSEGIDADTRNDSVEALAYYLENGKPANLARPFAALSMGLVGRAIVKGGGQTPEEEIRKPIRDKYAEGGDPRARGAFAIASGLVKDPLAVESLTDTLADAGANARLRGYCAVSLGMIGDSSAQDAIQTALTEETDRDLRVQTAVAAGLMGDANVIGDLVTILESGEESQYVLGSVALALGQIGDERAIEPLLAISEDADDKFPAITRALATVALGQIGDRRDVPTLARVARDINFRAIGGVPALTELLTIL